MNYIDTIKLPSQEEINRYSAIKNDSLYPWTIFFQNQFEWVICKDITVFYGNNGSGKSTLINLIAEKINAQRNNELFKDVIFSTFTGEEIHPFDDLVKSIDIRMAIGDDGEERLMPAVRKIITSDSIFKKIGDRALYNEVTVNKIRKARAERDEIIRNGQGMLFSSDKYDEFAKLSEARKLSKTQYAKRRTKPKEEMMSNGETVLDYYNRAFESGGIYLLDEPENCLSPVFQIELIKLIQDSVKYFDCQFIICTHSPFVLGIDNAMIYNLDKEPVISQKWEELENVRIYFDFFESRKDKFK